MENRIKFPEITPEMAAAAKLQVPAMLTQITLCKKCSGEGYGFRMGCKCGGTVEWFLKTQDLRYLRWGIDVSLITDNPEYQ